MLDIVGRTLVVAIAGQAGEVVSKAVNELLNEAETSSYTSKITAEVIG